MLDRFKTIFINLKNKPDLQVELVRKLPKLFNKLSEDEQKVLVRSNPNIIDHVINGKVRSQLTDEVLALLPE